MWITALILATRNIYQLIKEFRQINLTTPLKAKNLFKNLFKIF